MPRSGTTLVEQIISSHSRVTGAGELNFIHRFGSKLAVGLTKANTEALSVFRNRYLKEIAKRSNCQGYLTDKMPQNFRYIGLIRAAFPEAKIIHVYRDAKATCWSNYKHYFSSGNGFTFNQEDLVKFFQHYSEIMEFWHKLFPNKIYDLSYEKITENQKQTICLPTF